MIGAIFASTAT